VSGQYLVAVYTIINFFHLFTLKIKAAFRSLTEMRLNISTLLTADFKHRKTAFPLDINIISDFSIMSRNIGGLYAN
jgi:hypothetical protein